MERWRSVRQGIDRVRLYSQDGVINVWSLDKLLLVCGELAKGKYDDFKATYMYRSAVIPCTEVSQSSISSKL